MLIRRRVPLGFTIIEVVLVLAVAALIFLIVFLAIPAAQRSYRDEARRHDAGLLVGAVLEWKGNHRGDILDSDAELQSLLTKKTFTAVDPSTGTNYNLIFYPRTVIHTAVAAPSPGEMVYVSGHKCGTDVGTQTLITAESSSGIHSNAQFAVLVNLEVGDVFCITSD